jgi:hypothetical protein
MESPTSACDRNHTVQAWISDVRDAASVGGEVTRPSLKRKRLRRPLSTMDDSGLPNTRIARKRRTVKEVAVETFGVVENEDALAVESKSSRDDGLQLHQAEGEQNEEDNEDEQDEEVAAGEEQTPRAPVLRPATRSHGSASAVAAKQSPTRRPARRRRKMSSPPLSAFQFGQDGAQETLIQPSSSQISGKAYSQALKSDSHSAVASTTSLSSTNSTRNRSPVRKMGDLQMAEKPIQRVPFDDFSQLPEDVRDLYAEVLACSDGMEVVPAEVEVC